MDKRVVLALAGSGKTYYIAHDFEESNRIYMISFTNRNVENIRNEVRKRFNGIVPKNVMITTFDTFVYNQMLKPIEKLLKPRGIVLNGVEVGQNLLRMLEIIDISLWTNVNIIFSRIKYMLIE